MITFGTHSLRAEECINTIKLAIQIGYRRIDTASAYKNEALVAKGISESKIPRNQIHITTKVGPKDVAKGFEGVKKCVLESLENLRVAEDDENNDNSNNNYIDCVLLHWPGAAGLPPTSEKHIQLRQQAWKALCELKKSEIVKEIGVSNFLVRHLDSILAIDKKPEGENVNTTIDVVQMELHPWCRQQEVVDWCRKHNVKRIESYGLFGGGKCIERVLKEEGVVEEKSKTTTTSPSLLLLHWCIRQGFVPVVRASKKEHLEQNLMFLNERPIRDYFGGKLSTGNDDDDDDEKKKLQKQVDEHFYWHSNLVP